MSKLKWVLIVIGILLILLGLTMKLAWKIEEIRCWNMPLNDFYRDKNCLRHTWTYEEMNKR
jgi:hypothetical protein